ncbi:MAG: hypothetical protein HY707_04375 [Ignavibacteriae bacterium]|nr:hypothetical protein [Ignavibacteriota bacterium]
MIRINLIFTALLAVFLVIEPQGYSQEKSTRKNALEIAKQKEQKVGYACPMHPEVTSDQPGDCAKCGMPLEKSESSEITSVQDKILQAKMLMKEAKDEVIQNGKYSCCTKSPCNVCLMEHQNCDCYKDLKANKAVCNECYAGWQRGDGADKEIKASSVKTSYKKHSH